MHRRVYGLIAIASIMSNWNADFTGNPKSINDGSIYGSDKALKHSIKKYWKDNEQKVLYFKTYKIDPKSKENKNKIQPKELKERYEELFEKKLEKKTSSKEVLSNLFSAVDVMNFGATFAVEDQNISITGVVQIGQGFNKYEDTQVEVQDILSPFRNSKNEDADASSLGKKIMSDEAHYFYPFSINPRNYDEYKDILEDFNGYTKEAYELFKNGSLIGATALNTNSKCGCENEFTLFIELKEGSEMYIPNLDRYVEFSKGQKKNVIDITGIKDVLDENMLEDIENVEIYYNPATTEIKQPFVGAKLRNIFTKASIEQ